jgi:hypothetical protein
LGLYQFLARSMVQFKKKQWPILMNKKHVLKPNLAILLPLATPFFLPVYFFYKTQ